jgi:polyisoprenyl-phosphate glycosyltransferase
MKLISIVVPAYNEEKNIPLLYQKIIAIFDMLKNNYAYEIIFVNDGSVDSTINELEKISKENEAVKYIDFSRNFGKEIATSAGIHHCSGDACILIDADLQHPIELIPRFIQKWEQGYEVIVGVRKKSKSDSWIKKIGSKLFYNIMDSIAEVKIVSGSTDFRLIDRKVIDEFNRFSETKRLTRGLIDWLGFKKDYIYFEANDRINGIASYSFRKLVNLALTSFTSLSLFPLKLTGYFGIFITLLSSIIGFYILLGKYFFNWPFASTFSDAENLAIFIVFLVGIILMSIGLLALYIANIQREVINRPLYVIRNKKI